jgi:hypothetical protein
MYEILFFRIKNYTISLQFSGLLYKGAAQSGKNRPLRKTWIEGPNNP